jgi:hypothetical protein
MLIGIIGNRNQFSGDSITGAMDPIGDIRSASKFLCGWEYCVVYVDLVVWRKYNFVEETALSKAPDYDD